MGTSCLCPGPPSARGLHSEGGTPTETPPGAGPPASVASLPGAAVALETVGKCCCPPLGSPFTPHPTPRPGFIRSHLWGLLLLGQHSENQRRQGRGSLWPRPPPLTQCRWGDGSHGTKQRRSRSLGSRPRSSLGLWLQFLPLEGCGCACALCLRLCLRQISTEMWGWLSPPLDRAGGCRPVCLLQVLFPTLLVEEQATC